jgi:hypothetical protein
MARVQRNPHTNRNSAVRSDKLKPPQEVTITTTIEISDPQKADKEIRARSKAGASWVVLSPTQPITASAIEHLAATIQLPDPQEAK